MPRKRQNFPILPILLALLLPVIAFAIWFSISSSPVNPQSSEVSSVTINQGQGLSSIGNLLKEKNLIRSTLAFRIQANLSGLGNSLQAGDFSLSPRQNLKDIIISLTKSSYDRRVLFKEGQRREEYAQAFVDAFSPNNKDYAFDPDVFLALTKDLEGQLFPDTYDFPKNATAGAVVKKLTARFQEQTSNLINQSTLTDADALTLASLVEREAKGAAERPIIAGILLKRLQNDWPLQVDATVRYFKATATCKILTCNWWTQDITRADIDRPSPFNTYVNQGLPPHPIANPSLASIKAAYDPSPSAYWFYIHEDNGQIHYAKTIEEHNANIARYLGK